MKATRRRRRTPNWCGCTRLSRWCILGSLLLALFNDSALAFTPLNYTAGFGSNKPSSSPINDNDNTAVVGSSFALVGKVYSTLSQFFIGPEKAKAIVNAISRDAHVGDLVLIGFFGWALIPISETIYNHVASNNQQEDSDSKSRAMPSTALTATSTDSLFRQSHVYWISNLLSQIAKIGALVYFTDVLSIALNVLDFAKPFNIRLSHSVAYASYATWFAWQMSRFKKIVLCRSIKVPSPDLLGKASVYDKLGDAVLFVTTALFLLDVISIETGRAVNSVFALGSLGTLVFSLASKDVASQLVSGLVLAAAGKFHEGEDIRLGDNTGGKVTKIGWLYTELRASDETIIKIPNADLASQRISNISRVRQSQVKQSVLCRYDDLHKLHGLVRDIRQEIIQACPRLIRDGTRPFRVHLREFRDHFMEVVVDTHFSIPVSGDAYWENRQRVLEAIARALQKHECPFAMPTVAITTNNTNEAGDDNDGGDSNNDISETTKEPESQTTKKDQVNTQNSEISGTATVQQRPNKVPSMALPTVLRAAAEGGHHNLPVSLTANKTL